MLQCLILADIHGNLAALDAILSTPQARECSRIISLGDHLNYGPWPREVQSRLSSLGTLFLLGNHEERMRHLQDPRFSGYNWNLLKWSAEQAGPLPPMVTDLQLGSVLMTHGTPGNPYHLLLEEKDVAAVLDALPGDISLLLSGHNHAPWTVLHGGRTAVNPGSVGLCENRTGCIAPFAVLTLTAGQSRVRVYGAPYDPRHCLDRYLQTDLPAIAPELSRAVWEIMRYGTYQLLPMLVSHIQSVARERGLPSGDAAAWAAGDATFPWRTPGSSREFWDRAARQG